MIKFIIFNYQFLKIVFLLIVLFLIVSPFYEPVNAATNCQKNTTNPRAQGLISGLSINDLSKFGNTSKNCVFDPKAVFAPYQVYTYDDLKSIFYAQSKTAKETLPSGSLPASFNGNKVYVTNPSFPTISAGGSPTGSGTEIIFVEGNLNVTSNLTYHTSDNNGGLVFVVKGDVNIESTVTSLDAVIISTGTICTASVSGSCTGGTEVTPQLTINGSLVSLNQHSPIQFVRNLGATNTTTPAEVVNQQVKYLITLKDMFAQVLTYRSEDVVLPNAYTTLTNLFVSCGASPNPTSVGSQVTWSAIVTAGTGIYNYTWSGAVVSNETAPTAKYSNVGTQNATVTVVDRTTGGSATKACTPLDVALTVGTENIFYVPPTGTTNPPVKYINTLIYL